MRRLLFALVGSAFFASSALATPWFDQGWAEDLVAWEMPGYWVWINEIRERNEERYLNMLLEGRMVVLHGQDNPDLRAAWEDRWDSQMLFERLRRQWSADPDSRSDELRFQVLDAAEEYHLAKLALFEVRREVMQRQLDILERQIVDQETNLESHIQDDAMSALGE